MTPCLVWGGLGVLGLQLLTATQRKSFESLVSLMHAPCVPKAMMGGSNTLCNWDIKYMGDGTHRGKKTLWHGRRDW